MTVSPTRVCALLLGAVLLLSGCGGGDDEQAAPGTSPSSAASSAAAAAGPADAAAAEAEVKAAWEGFFDGAAPATGKAALIERAADLAPALQLAGADPNAAKVTAAVKSVSFTSPTEAMVTYDLASAGTVVLPDAQGKAVLEAGAWKVSAQTFCQLAALRSQGAAVPGCS